MVYMEITTYRRAPEPTVVALVFDDDGTIYDRVWAWEAGQNYALHEGRKVVAVARDRYMGIAEAQEIYDAERARFLDCWGGES